MTFDELIEKNEEYVTDPYETWDDSDKTAAWVERERVYPRPSSMVSGTNYKECLKRPLRSRSGPGALEVRGPAFGLEATNKYGVMRSESTRSETEG